MATIELTDMQHDLAHTLLMIAAVSAAVFFLLRTIRHYVR